MKNSFDTQMNAYTDSYKDLAERALELLEQCKPKQFSELDIRCGREPEHDTKGEEKVSTEKLASEEGGQEQDEGKEQQGQTTVCHDMIVAWALLRSLSIRRLLNLNLLKVHFKRNLVLKTRTRVMAMQLKPGRRHK
jgi:hypothetical protein